MGTIENMQIPHTLPPIRKCNNIAHETAFDNDSKESKKIQSTKQYM